MPDLDMTSSPPRRQRHHGSSPDQHSRGRSREDGARRRSREDRKRNCSRDGGSNKRQRSGSRSKDQEYRKGRDRPSDRAYESSGRRRSRSRVHRAERQYKRKDSPERHRNHSKSDYGHNERQPERYRARSPHTEGHKPEPGSTPKVNNSDVATLIKKTQEEFGEKLASLYKERERISLQHSPHPSKTRRDSTPPRREEHESKARRDTEQDTDRTKLRDERSKAPPKESSASAKPVDLMSNKDFPGTECGNCADPEHRLHVCVWPVDEFGFLNGCPRCNTKMHLYNECPVPMAKRYTLDDWYFLVHARNNKPPIRDNVDVRSITRKRGCDKTEFPWTYGFSMKQASKGFLKGYQSSGESLSDPAWLNLHGVPSQVHPTHIETAYMKMKDEVAKIRQEIQAETEERGVEREPEGGRTPSVLKKLDSKPEEKEGLTANKRQQPDLKPGEDEGSTRNKRQRVDSKDEEDKVTGEKGGGSG